MERVIRNLMFIVIIAGGVSSCASTQALVDKSLALVGGESGLRVKQGEVVRFPAPLPDYYPFISEGPSKRLIARGWDMNKDGRLDQIEVLGLEGQVILRLFDFDADGEIDQRQVVGKETQQDQVL